MHREKDYFRRLELIQLQPDEHYDPATCHERHKLQLTFVVNAADS